MWGHRLFNSVFGYGLMQHFLPVRRIRQVQVLLVPMVLLALVGIAPGQQPVAFPGAVGQGAAASGGRRGDVYHVTTLADYHPKNETKIPGSLRHAIRSAEGPRTIVFDVGGAIELHAPLEIHKSNLTIAGQTAPSPGITLWGYPVEITKATNVIFRYLRFRMGDFHVRVGDSTKPHSYQGNGDLDPQSANAMFIGGGSDTVICDHLSTCWSTDETFSVTTCRNVTIQNCIIAQSLNNSFHPKGEHGYGSLIRGELSLEDQAAGAGAFTFYRNLWAHHRARNPSFGGQQNLDDGQSETDRRRTDVNLINNVVYDWRDQAFHRSELGTVRANVISNYFVCGPEKRVDRVFKEGASDETQVFHAGNFLDSDQDADHDGHDVSNGKAAEKAFQNFDDADQLLSENSKPFSFIGKLEHNIVSANAAYENVVATVGCSLTRDAVDEALIDSLTSRTGNLIDSQEELRDSSGKLAGIDDVPENHRPTDFDTDRDGMPNEFEKSHSLDPANPADGNGTQLSDAGYTNLEVYMNGLAVRTE
jgi:hypothetical protein